MKNKHSLSKSKAIAEIPLACSDELAAVEFFEAQRWRTTPACVHCGSVQVYKMLDAQTGERNRRFLWRCRDCRKQYTVRIGTVYEESRIELRHWCYAFWRAATSKKGVAALEIQRHCQISYKSALFLMNRIRFAMAPDFAEVPKLTGTVEVDETYVGGKPRFRGISKRGRPPYVRLLFRKLESSPMTTGPIMESAQSTQVAMRVFVTARGNTFAETFIQIQRKVHLPS